MTERPNLPVLIRDAITALKAVLIDLERDEAGGVIGLSRLRIRVAADSLEEAANILQARRELS